MAKLSANGNRKVGQVTAELATGRHVFALRSDGKVLHRIAGFYNDNGAYTAHATGYSIFGSMKPENGTTHTLADVDRLAGILGRKGYTITKVGN